MGDATGYVEPFTGEGMSWAFSSAEHATRLMHRSLRSWDDSYIPEWNRWVQSNAMNDNRLVEKRSVDKEPPLCKLGFEIMFLATTLAMAMDESSQPLREGCGTYVRFRFPLTEIAAITYEMTFRLFDDGCRPVVVAGSKLRCQGKQGYYSKDQLRDENIASNSNNHPVAHFLGLGTIGSRVFHRSRRCCSSCLEVEYKSSIEQSIARALSKIRSRASRKRIASER